MRILFLSRWFPVPANNGSKLRIFNLLRGLAPHHALTLISFAEGPLAGMPAPLRELCDEVYLVPHRPYRPRSLPALRGLLSPVPRSLVATHVPEMAARIQQQVARGRYDLVICSQWDTAAYWPAFDGLPALFEEAEVGSLEAKRARAGSVRGRLRHGLPLLKLRWYLRRLLPRFGACTVASGAEAARLRRLAPRYGAIEVVPNCVSVADYAAIRAEPQPHTLIFTGSLSYDANYDAMCWFLQEVFPLVQAQVPEARLLITGEHAERPLPPARHVTRAGLLADVRPAVASSWVSIAPLRVGGGTRLKILEALALGTPVVATSLGAEGLALCPGEHLMLGDTPEAFAGAVVRLLRTPALRARLAAAGQQRVRQQYDWAATLPRFLSLVERVAGQG